MEGTKHVVSNAHFFLSLFANSVWNNTVYFFVSPNYLIPSHWTAVQLSVLFLQTMKILLRVKSTCSYGCSVLPRKAQIFDCTLTSATHWSILSGIFVVFCWFVSYSCLVMFRQSDTSLLLLSNRRCSHGVRTWSSGVRILSFPSNLPIWQPSVGRIPLSERWCTLLLLFHS